MALKDRSSFAGRNLQAPSVAPAIQALQSVGGLITGEEDRRRQELLDADVRTQRAIENQRASDRLSLDVAQGARQEIVSKRNQAIYDAGLAEEKELARLVGSVPSKITGTKTIPGVVTPSNQALIDERNAYNAAIDRSQGVLDIDRDIAGAQYDAAYNEFLSREKKPETVSNTVPQAVYSGGNIIGSSARTGPLLKKDGTEASWWDEVTGKVKVVKEFSEADRAATVSPVAPKIGATVESEEFDLAAKADEFAMKESGMDKVVERFNKVVDKKDVPALVEATEAASKQIAFNRDMTKAEQKEALRVAIKNSQTLSGSGKISALGNVDKMFAKDKKGLTFDQMFKTKKYQAEKAEENRVLKDYKDTYKNMPDNISTIKGAEAFIAKANKRFKQTGTGFLEDLYTNLSVKDAGDVEDIDKWYAQNKSAINQMSKNEQKALGAKMKALYSQESKWLDVTDYFGGSAFGDISAGFGVK